MSPDQEESKEQSIKPTTEELLEGKFPGLTQALEHLRHGQIGRAIVSTDERKYLGQILPVTPENDRHVVILVDGSIAVVEPVSSDRIEDYKKNVSPSESPFLTGARTAVDLFGDLISKTSYL